MRKNKREIGSEFWEIPLTRTENNLFFNSTQWFISERSALKAIIKDSGINSITLPDWCCDSMIMPFYDNKIHIEFYPAFQTEISVKTDAVLLMDYFGFSTDRNLNEFNGTIIQDITHSMFSKKYENADYYFGSLRKWAGFWTGGFAYGFKNAITYDKTEAIADKYICLRKSAMKEKSDYIYGHIENKAFLNTFNQAESLLDSMGIAPAANRDIEQAKRIDIDTIKKKRKANAEILLNAFQDEAIFSGIGNDGCPLFVPIRVGNRDAVRNNLISNDIYCPVHWPISRFHKLTQETVNLYNEELSLVCDQRYNEDDMNRIVDCIRNFERNA